MADEIITPEIGTETGADEDYIATIEKMRSETVPKEMYYKLRGENKKLLDALASGGQITTETPQETGPSIDELRKTLFGPDCDELSAVQFWEASLSLRDSLIGAGERDPWLAVGDKVDLTTEQVETTERVATVIRECLDLAQGDDGIFTAELQRRTIDAGNPRRPR